MAVTKEEIPEDAQQPQEQAPQAAEEQPVTGRAAFMSRWRDSNPDITDDPDDDTMYDWAGSQMDDLSNRYNSVNGANEKLAEVVGQDPQIGRAHV